MKEEYLIIGSGGAGCVINRLMDVAEKTDNLVVVSSEIPEYTPPTLEPLKIRLYEPKAMTFLPSKGSKYHK